jgi:hypothetical protein
MRLLAIGAEFAKSVVQFAFPGGSLSGPETGFGADSCKRIRHLRASGGAGVEARLRIAAES